MNRDPRLIECIHCHKLIPWEDYRKHRESEQDELTWGELDVISAKWEKIIEASDDLTPAFFTDGLNDYYKGRCKRCKRLVRLVWSVKDPLTGRLPSMCELRENIDELEAKHHDCPKKEAEP